MRGVAGARYTGRRVPARWYLAQLPQGRKAARVSELFQVRGGLLLARRESSGPPSRVLRVADDDALGLFDEDDLGESADARLEYEQDGPDLFGLEPDELILPTEPTPLDDPEMEIELDSMDEIPIDAEDEPEVEATMPDPLIEQAIGSSVEGTAGPHDDDAAVAAPAEFSGTSPEASAAQSIPPAPEAPLALYRRYRPETFDQVIGQVVQISKDLS